MNDPCAPKLAFNHNHLLVQNYECESNIAVLKSNN